MLADCKDKIIRLELDNRILKSQQANGFNTNLNYE